MSWMISFAFLLFGFVLLLFSSPSPGAVADGTGGAVRKRSIAMVSSGVLLMLVGFVLMLGISTGQFALPIG